MSIVIVGFKFNQGGKKKKTRLMGFTERLTMKLLASQISMIVGYQCPNMYRRLIKELPIKNYSLVHIQFDLNYLINWRQIGHLLHKTLASVVVLAINK